MKFTSLDQVVERWAERYAASGDRDDLLPSPGYSEEAIAAIEQKLAITFHPSFRRVLLSVNLNTVSFRRLSFGGDSAYLRYLGELNTDVFSGKPLDQRSVLIAGGEGDLVILNNQDGSIAAGDHEVRFERFSAAALNMEQFICTLATIVNETEPIWRTFKTRQEGVEAANLYLDQLGITQNREFWINVFRGTI